MTGSTLKRAKVPKGSARSASGNLAEGGNKAVAKAAATTAKSPARLRPAKLEARLNTRDIQLESRCQRFVEVAQELFLERGFAGTSVNEVVRRAGGSLATLYAEFGTKDELFEAVMNRRAANMFTDIINSNSVAADTESEILQLARRLQAHILSENALALYRLAIHEGPKFPSVRNAVLINGLNGFLQRLGDYFATLAERGLMKADDPAAAAELFLTLIQGQLRTIAACGDSETISQRRREQHAKRAVRIFLQIHPAQTGKRKAAPLAAR